MKQYKIEYMIAGSVIIEAEHRADALIKFDCIPNHMLLEESDFVVESWDVEEVTP